MELVKICVQLQCCHALIEVEMLQATATLFLVIML